MLRVMEVDLIALVDRVPMDKLSVSLLMVA